MNAKQQVGVSPKPRTVFVVTRGLSDSNNDPVSEIVGVFSTPEKARAAAEANAPHSGSVDQYVIDALGLDPLDE